ncbi:MAG: hypothetical protein EAZ24_06045 [Burkholderiales bacterium]|nr:MAG: hypothetical protein EAZ24_06045 [Burkholderiales bacterium]
MFPPSLSSGAALHCVVSDGQSGPYDVSSTTGRYRANIDIELLDNSPLKSQHSRALQPLKFRWYELIAPIKQKRPGEPSPLCSVHCYCQV